MNRVEKYNKPIPEVLQIILDRRTTNNNTLWPLLIATNQEEATLYAETPINEIFTIITPIDVSLPLPGIKNYTLNVMVYVQGPYPIVDFVLTKFSALTPTIEDLAPSLVIGTTEALNQFTFAAPAIEISLQGEGVL